MERFGFALISLVICVSGCDVSSDNSAGVDTSVRVEPHGPRQVVEQVLREEMTPETRMKALEPYVDVGRSKEEVEKVLDSSYSAFGYGPGFVIVRYGEWGKPGLNIDYYPDGEACSITFWTKDGKTVNLRSDDPITWPKTTDGKNALLRQKKGK